LPLEEYFWRLKAFYPGDPEFTWEKYSSLPYPYVVTAYVRGSDLYRERMHDQERPTAMVSALLANSQRDPKKNKKPPTWEDFSFYKPRNGGSTANYVYGSAMLEMAKKRRLPGWALFCFKEVVETASAAYVPAMCAFVAEDAMLLHPVRAGEGWEGMLIATESASEQERVFVDDSGAKHVLRVPHVHTKVICQEDVILSR